MPYQGLFFLEASFGEITMVYYKMTGTIGGLQNAWTFTDSSIFLMILRNFPKHLMFPKNPKDIQEQASKGVPP